MNYFIRFPGHKAKALTLSYDDGPVQDVRLIGIMSRHGIKGTFNLNGKNYIGTPGGGIHPKLSRTEALELYPQSGMEVAVHSFTHPYPAMLPEGGAAYEFVKDREVLEDMFGGIIRGMAYPEGSYDSNVKLVAAKCGLVYGRTTGVTHSFDLPKDWMELPGTIRNKDPELMAVCDRFLNLENIRAPRLFYMWGHSYEFDDTDSWDVIENFCKKMGGHADIWYATNIEIYEYLHAAAQIVCSIDGKLLYNPTATVLYLVKDKKDYELAPGGYIRFP